MISALRERLRGARGDGARFVRYTSWNLVAVAVPIAVGLAAIPVLTRALGPARFGLLALAWALLEYLAVFDFGLSRATLRHVAQRRQAHDPSLAGTVTASLAAQTALGAAAGILLALLAPTIVARVLRVPPELALEAHRALLVLAATMPFVLLALGLRALLEAAERFDLAARVRAPASSATFAVPAIAAAAGATLPTILALLLVVRVVTCAASWAMVRRALPTVAIGRPRELASLRSLFGIGGWMAVSSLLTPVFLYWDRLALGAVGGIVAVGLYAGAAELTLRLLMVPAVVVGAVFPAASALAGSGDHGSLRRLHRRTGYALFLLLLPVVVTLVVAAPQIIRVLLGDAYVATGATVLRLLAPGVLLSAVAHAPVAFLQAAGRADVSGRLHLAMALLHVALVTALVVPFGAPGAAAAFTLRAVVDLAAVSWLARRYLPGGEAAREAPGGADVVVAPPAAPSID